MEQANGRITLKMIAERAGTSIGTVDRALNNRPGISAKRRDEILAIAADMGYRPNLFASALGRKKEIRIGIAYPRVMAEFYRYVDLGVEAAAAELRDYGVVVEKIRYETQHPADAVAALQRLDLSRFDGLVLNSSGGELTGFINALAAQGKPVATFNSDSEGTSRLFYVGSDGREAGRVGAELLALLLRGSGKVAVLGNFATATPFLERFGGFCEYLQPGYSGIHLLPCAECQGDRELAAQNLADLLAGTPDIGAVFATGYTSTVGAVEALRALNRRDVYLVGFDVTPFTATALEEGWCTALIHQEPYRQGYNAARLMAKHLLEGWLPAGGRVLTDNSIVLKSHLAAHKEKYINPQNSEGA